MDKIEGTQAAFVGSGFATAKNLIANYSLDGAYEAPETATKTAPASQPEPRVLSVSTILDDARTEISKLTGIPMEGISLDLHLKA